MDSPFYGMVTINYPTLTFTCSYLLAVYRVFHATVNWMEL